MIIIDNYDSFTYNLVEYVKELGITPKIYKNDEITIKELKTQEFSSIIISPGPKTPKDAGISKKVIKEFYKTKKILGICLGHQCIAETFKGKIIKAPQPYHGKLSKIYFVKNPLFKSISQGFCATRYHSLIVDEKSLNDNFEKIAYTKDRILMGIKLKQYPVYGLQFHPEAILTEYGIKIINNFLNI